MIKRKELLKFIKEKNIDVRVINNINATPQVKKELYDKLLNICIYEFTKPDNKLQRFFEIICDNRMQDFFQEYKNSSEDLLSRLLEPAILLALGKAKKINHKDLYKIISYISKSRYHSFVGLFYSHPAKPELHSVIYKIIIHIQVHIGKHAVECFLQILFSSEYFYFVKEYLSQDKYHVEVIKVLKNIAIKNVNPLTGTLLLKLLQSQSYKEVCNQYYLDAKKPYLPLIDGVHDIFLIISKYSTIYPFESTILFLFEQLSMNKLIKKLQVRKLKRKAVEDLIYITLKGATENELNNILLFTKSYLKAGNIEKQIYAGTIRFFREDLNGLFIGNYLVNLFNGKSFKNIYFNYGNVRTLMEFIVEHIFESVRSNKLKIHGLVNTNLFIKLVLQERLDRELIVKYQFLFKVAKEIIGSEYLEVQLMEYLYHIFIYSVLEKYFLQKETEVSLKNVSRYYSKNHKRIHETIEAEPLYYFENIDYLDKRDQFKNKIMSLIWIVRQDLVDDIVRKCSQEREEITKHLIPVYRHLNFLVYTSVRNHCEDQLYKALYEILMYGDLKLYRQHIEDVLRSEPDNDAIKASFDAKAYCTITFEEAQTFFSPYVWLLIGNYPVIPSDKHEAYTNNVEIVVPDKFSCFIDPKDPSIKNRNLTLFVSVVLHEVYHIRALSFKYDLTLMIKNMKLPGLFKLLLNICEDYRIESYAKEEDIIPQIHEVFDFFNTYHVSLFQYNNTPEDLIIMLSSKIISNRLPGDFDKDKRVYEDRFLAGKIKNGVLNGKGFIIFRKLYDECLDIASRIVINKPSSSIKAAYKIYELISPLYYDKFNLNLLPSLQGQPIEDVYVFADQDDQDDDDDDESSGGAPKSKKIRYFDELDEESDANGESGNEVNPEISLFDDQRKRPVRGFSQPDNSDGADDKEIDTYLDDYLDKQSPGGGQQEKGADNEKKDDAPSPTKIDTIRIASYSSHAGRFVDVNEIKHEIVNKQSTPFIRKLQEYEYLIYPLQRMINIFKEKERKRKRITRVGESLNIERFIDNVIDDTNLSDPKFMETSIKKQIHPHIIIGIDASGSTSNMIKEAKLTILDIEKIFSMLFYQVFEQIAFKIEAYAFDYIKINGKDKDQKEHAYATRIREFKEWKTISALEFGFENRDGDFIRYINRMFTPMNGHKKFFFFCSDGRPYAPNYKGEEALVDTALALRELRRSGVKIAYFNIDSNKDAQGNYYELFAEECNYAKYFASPHDLLMEIPKIGKALLTKMLK